MACLTQWTSLAADTHRVKKTHAIIARPKAALNRAHIRSAFSERIGCSDMISQSSKPANQEARATAASRANAESDRQRMSSVSHRYTLRVMP